MSWATHYIAKLLAGETVQFRPHGNSMVPKIKSGQLCTVVPFDGHVEAGDVVLCKVRGRQFLHLVSAIRGEEVQISNNHGHVNGWTSKKQIYGKLIRVED